MFLFSYYANIHDMHTAKRPWATDWQKALYQLLILSLTSSDDWQNEETHTIEGGGRYAYALYILV